MSNNERPSVGVWYKTNPDGSYTKWSTKDEIKEWIPWTLFLIVLFLGIIGLIILAGPIVLLIVSLYLYLGMVWITWNIIRTPSWPKSIQKPIQLNELIHIMFIVLPTWPLWATGVWYI